ncbi:MAG: Spy/CpxP family protein refolding chaperone [Hyphomicrobiales bacterium]|nr:Spy/CpxP family protein refolding chaperone [Hyphomicrobiales bacterium]MDE2113423.1 Spy/CpxP family protein refolding chaperone [Hyphomicrobiales bacterium]
MKKITKVIGIGAIVAALAGIGITAMAETSGHGFGPSFMHEHMGSGMGHRMMGMENGMGKDRQRGDFRNPAEHLATLKTELNITPTQTAAWDTYAKAVQDAAGQMPKPDMDTMRKMSEQDRTAMMTSMQSAHEETFAKVKTAAEALLPTLDDAQKAKAQTVLPGLAQRGPGRMGMMGSGKMGSGEMGSGMGMMHGHMDETHD